MITLSTVAHLDGGVIVTYEGTPFVCTYWQVVGVNGSMEVEAVGTLAKKIVLSDSSGRAVNQYIGSDNSADVGKTERIKVQEAL